MKHVGAFLIVVVACGSVAFAQSPMARVLENELEIQRALQDEELAQLQRIEARLAEAWTRVGRGTADFLHAQVEGEDVPSLRRRDDDLREAEGQVVMDLLEMQRLRRSTIERDSLIAQTRAQLRQMQGTQSGEQDLITGNWALVMEPGGQKGSLTLTLDGTLIQGTYELDGGWTGSMRGTLVGGRVRLERIDSQAGFVAIFYGKVRVDGDGAVLEGKWEATQLATGMPAAGGWVAHRLRSE